MRHLLPTVLLVLFCNAIALFAQNNLDRSVLLSATIQESPAKITLNWPAYPNATKYYIYKKGKDAALWVGGIDSVPGSAVSYSDNNVKVGVAYEYRVVRVAATTGFGYIYAGIKLPEVDTKGGMLVLMEDTYLAQLTAEKDQLIEDLTNDGWSVYFETVKRTDSVMAVKNKIIQYYKRNPDLKSVFLVGRVPVPYSGNIYPDGHPDHLGAWPSDGFYGEVLGEWSDNEVSNAGASRPENRNVPGDGKFDNSIFPTYMKLQVGRVDMFNMPAFGTELDLLKRYFKKNHDFKVKKNTAEARGLVDDNFQGYNIAIAGFRNFPPMFGANNVVNNVTGSADYRTNMLAGSYLWSYGAGGGSYTSCGGVTTSADYVKDSLRTIFTMLAGSYFGDWDNSNNMLRAPLASKSPTLVSFWGGIPSWQLHHMAMGENIGYSTRLSQSNNGILYDGNFNGALGRIHIALMGDPSLRMHMVTPPSSFTANKSGTVVNMNWVGSTDAVLGYHVYRQHPITKEIERRNPSMIIGTTFSDTINSNLSYYYMVRAVKLEESASGSYYNMSLGVGSTIGGSGINSLDAFATTIRIQDLAGCGKPLAATFTVGNKGNQTISNFTVEYKIDNNAASTFVWTGSLPAGTTQVVELPLILGLTPGAHTLMVTILKPNGGVDGIQGDNAAITQFNYSSGASFTVELTTDRFGEETQYQIVDASNGKVLVAEDGFKSDTTYTKSYCLPTGCYTFNITDFFGDGICCTDGNGSYKLTIDGVAPFQGNGNFGYGNFVSFCVTDCEAQANVGVVASNTPGKNVVNSTVNTCLGKSVVLGATAAAGAEFKWANNSSNGPTTSVNPTQTTTYTLVTTLPNGCIVTSTVTVVVVPNPVANAGADVSICRGSSATLSASGGNTYLWSNGSTVADNNPVTPMSTTTYVVTVTNKEGCSATDAVVVNVKDVPVVNAGADIAVCEGISANLSATGATTYVWSTGQQGNTITINPAATTSYTVVGTTNSCSASDTITVTVKTAPKPTITPNGNICAGQKVTLVAGGGDSYVWSTGSNGSSIDVQPTQTSIYAVTVTNLEGCRAVAQTVVTVIAAPIVSLSPNITLCKGGNATLQAGGGTTFSWSTGEKTASIVVAPTVSSSYTVTVGNAAGCTAEKSVQVTVIDAVVANAGLDQAICTGSSATLTAAGGTDYLWNNGQTNKTITVNPLVTTTYVVTVSNGNCVGKDTVTVTVNPAPKADAGIDQTICQGSSASLTAKGGLTYIWSSGQTSETITVSPSSTTTYLVTVTNKEGCSATDLVIVLVNPLPVVTISGNKQICVGDSLTLEVNQTPNFQYVWSNGLAGSKITVAPNKTTAYTVSVTDFLGCKNQSTVQVIVNNLPVVDLGQDTITVQKGSTATLDAGSGQATYVWSNGATTSTVVVADPSALYCVTVTNQFGCKASDCIYAKFFVLGINELKNWEVKVYPNPTIGVLNIQATQLYPNMQLMIYNESGQLVERHKLDNLHIFIDVTDYPSGAYLIKFISKSGVKQELFMKQ